MKNPKIKRGTKVQLTKTPYGLNPELFNLKNYKVEAEVEWPTTKNTNTIHFESDGGRGIADVILQIKGRYSFEKHGFTCGGSVGPNTHKRVRVKHEDLILL